MFLVLLLYIRMQQVTVLIQHLLTVQVLAVLVLLFLKQPLSVKQKLTFSVSRLFFAAVLQLL